MYLFMCVCSCVYVPQYTHTQPLVLKLQGYTITPTFVIV